MRSSIEVSGSRLRQLDKSFWAVLAGHRLLLATVVVLGHCSSLVAGASDWTAIGRWLNQGSAVFGFFIISGYSIAASLENNLVGFYRRRVLRIWPLYLGCLVFGLFVSLRIPHGFNWPAGTALPPASPLSIIASFLMLQTLVASAIPIVGQIWSLSPEWWHYMVAPILRRAPTLVLLVLLGASFTAFILVPAPSGSGAEQMKYGLSLLTLSWLWMTGFVYRRFDGQLVGLGILVIPSLCALYFGHFTGAPLFATILVMLLNGKVDVSKRWRDLLLLLGDLSFPLYLFHIPTMVLLLTFGLHGSAWMVGGSFLASAAALFLIDYPCRRYFRTDALRLSHIATGMIS